MSGFKNCCVHHARWLIKQGVPFLKIVLLTVSLLTCILSSAYAVRYVVPMYRENLCEITDAHAYRASQFYQGAEGSDRRQS